MCCMEAFSICKSAIENLAAPRQAAADSFRVNLGMTHRYKGLLLSETHRVHE